MFIVLELIIWSCWYCFGQKGIASIRSMQYNNAVCELQLKELQEYLIDCNHQLAQWHLSSFYKEQIAREQLQMARQNEIIFIVDRESL